MITNTERLLVGENFMMRKPSQSIEFFDQINNASSLKELLSDQVIEAITASSADTGDAIQKYLNDMLPAKEQAKLELSIYKYLVRMSTRCTPYGLFASVSTGQFGRDNLFELEDNKLELINRIDFGLLDRIVHKFIHSTSIIKNSNIFPNSSLIKVASHYHYTTYKILQNGKRVHSSQRLKATEILNLVVENSKKGIGYQSLTDLLVECGLEVAIAEKYLMDLLNGHVIETDVQPSVLSKNPLELLIGKITQPDIRDYLKELFELISGMQSPGLIQEIDRIHNAIKGLNIEHPRDQYVQFDCLTSYKKLELNSDIKASIKKAFLLHSYLSDNTNSTLTKFKDEFIKRYDTREVSLLLALDPDLGIGYGLNSSINNDVHPLIHDLINFKKEESLAPFNVFQSFLFQKLQMNGDKSSLKLKFEDLTWLTEIGELPKDIACIATLIKSENGYQIKVPNFFGSSSGNLISRFSHVDPEINNQLTSQLNYFHQEADEVIIAEIAHIPYSRLGNILVRPNFTKYVIDYLGNYNHESEYCIKASDLYLFSSGGEIFLKSKSLGKIVVPRNTTAHNYSIPTNLPVYQFLSDIQVKHSIAQMADFGNYTNTLRHIPRIEVDEIILSSETWNIMSSEVLLFLQSRNYESLDKWRNENQIPHTVNLVQGDNTIPIKFENQYALKVLEQAANKNPSLKLEEFIQDSSTCYKHSNGLHYTNEFVFNIQSF